jgi:hypothetical protein
MQDYFRNLNALDPLFHALVRSQIRKREERDSLSGLSLESLTEDDELEILRDYCATLYKEYRTLRTIFLEKMQVTSRSVSSKHSTN